MLAALLLAATFVVPADGATFAHDIAALHAAKVHGVESFVVNTKTDIKGGPIHRTDASETAFVTADGEPAHKRVMKSVDDGKAADAAGLAKLSTEAEGALSRFSLRLPYIAGAIADYSFAKPRELAETVELDFTTHVKDQSHGDGTMVVNRATGRIETVTFHPSELPKHATTGTVTIEFGIVIAPERWDIVKITRSFSGHEGFIRGTVVSVSVYDRYRAYATQPAAVAAVDAISN